MGAKEMYIQLRAAGLTAEGACGILGNMQAESGLKANIAQRGMTNRTDEDYTSAADMGAIDFAHDSVGYGLCQWTYWSRKQALLKFARQVGVSVGDEATQVRFCLAELRTDYPALYTALCSDISLCDATARVCKEYERPAVNNVNARYGYAQNFYAKVQSGAWDGFGSGTNTPILEPSETPQEAFWPPRMLDYKQGRKNLTGADVLALQAILAARGYECPTTGDFDARTRLCVMEFQAESGLVGDGVCGNATWTKLLNRK